MKTVKTAFLLLILNGPLAAYGSDEFQGVRRVHLRISSGTVKISGGESNLTRVDFTKKRYDERCQLITDQRGDLLYLELSSKSLYSARCEVDFRLKVPRLISLKLKSGNGNFFLDGIQGPVSADIGSGRLDLNGKISAFELRSSSGEARVYGLSAPASIRTGSGRVRLVYEKIPAEGKLDILSSSGDAEVYFPKGAKVRTYFAGGSGVLDNLLGNSEEARFTVSMKTGSGDLRLAPSREKEKP